MMRKFRGSFPFFGHKRVGTQMYGWPYISVHMSAFWPYPPVESTQEGTHMVVT